MHRTLLHASHFGNDTKWSVLEPVCARFYLFRVYHDNVFETPSFDLMRFYFIDNSLWPSENRWSLFLLFPFILLLLLLLIFCYFLDDTLLYKHQCTKSIVANIIFEFDVYVRTYVCVWERVGGWVCELRERERSIENFYVALFCSCRI